MRDEEILGELLESHSRDRHHAIALADSPQAAVFRCLQIPFTTYEVQHNSDGSISNHFGLEHVLSDWVTDLNNRPDVGSRRAL